jgi:hypothetical protein
VTGDDLLDSLYVLFVDTAAIAQQGLEIAHRERRPFGRADAGHGDASSIDDVRGPFLADAIDESSEVLGSSGGGDPSRPHGPFIRHFRILRNQRVIVNPGNRPASRRRRQRSASVADNDPMVIQRNT